MTMKCIYVKFITYLKYVWIFLVNYVSNYIQTQNLLCKINNKP